MGGDKRSKEKISTTTGTNVLLEAKLPQRQGYNITQAQRNEILRRLKATNIARYVKEDVGWDYVRDSVETVVMF